MSTAEKKDSSVLDEFEIPEHLGGVVEDLKNEQQTLSKEIEEARAKTAVRKQDESTKVFNLRQHQIELKIAELEEKKKKSEQELQGVLQQKNSTLHADLKKLAQYILQETKKIAPLGKEIETKLHSVTTLRNELQLVFENNLSDRKKNTVLIEEQNIHLHQLGELIRETSKLIQGDFHLLARDIEKIQTERNEEARKLAGLKQEVAHHKGLCDEIEARRAQLRELEDRIALGEKTAATFAGLDEEIAHLKDEARRLQEEKERLHSSTVRLHQEEFHGQENLARLKLRERHLENVISGKKDQLLTLEADVLDVRKRLEMRKNDEHEVHAKFLHHRDQLTDLQNEVARLEGARAAHETLVAEAQSLFEEKKAFFQRELELLEKLQHSRRQEIEAQGEAQRLRWEEEFQVFTEGRRAGLRAELEAQDRADLEDIRNKKREFLSEVTRIMSGILSSPEFTSTEERAKLARKEVEKSFELLFGKTRRWKFW